MTNSYSQQTYRENQDLYYRPKRRKISTLIIAKKTLLFDLFSIQKLLASVFFMLIVPIVAHSLVTVPADTSIFDEGYLSFIIYFYTYGLVFPIIIVASAGPLISEEVNSGTMLILVSKPIDRTRIMIGKFIALILFGMILSICTLSIISIMASMSYSTGEIPLFFGIFFIYSMCVLLFFGGFTLGLSGIFKKPKNVLLLPLLIVIFTFLIMFIFRPMLIMSEAYEDYQLYHLDIGYHLGNIYLGIVETFIPTIWEVEQFITVFAYFGLLKFEWIYNEQGYPIGTETNPSQYYPPSISFLLMTMMAMILLVIGTFMYYKREVSV